MPRRVPALGKLERLTGFRPATALPEIIDRVITHFQEKMGADLFESADGTGFMSPENLTTKRAATP
jgi:hypothetical protein